MPHCRFVSEPCPRTLQEMVCVEPAVAASGPVRLAAGASWRGVQTMRLQQDAVEPDSWSPKKVHTCHGGHT